MLKLFFRIAIFLIVLVLAIRASDISGSGKALYPVILIPGLEGSRLEAKLDRKDVGHFYCQRKTEGWYDLWVGLTDILPFGVDCLEDNMKLIYNTTTRKTQNVPGVSIRAANFGKCDSVEYVSSMKLPGTSYLVTMVKRLVEIGYERDKSILAAPYDFRKAFNELDDYFGDLKQLVERAYSENGNQPVVFICHSNGCQNNVYFLAKLTQAWKDKYVRSVIALGGIWAGAVKPLLAYTFGQNVGPFVAPGVVRRVFQTFPSVASQIPSKESFTAKDVLMRNGARNYTMLDYERFFKDVSHPEGYEMWLDVHKFASPLTVPNVELHCLHSYNVKTIEQYHWKSGGFPERKPEIIYGNGDGTVNIASLEACKKYQILQAQPFYYKTFASIEHQAMVDEREVFDHIKKILFDQITRDFDTV